jgi:hypothetical protein
MVQRLARDRSVGVGHDAARHSVADPVLALPFVSVGTATRGWVVGVGAAFLACAAPRTDDPPMMQGETGTECPTGSELCPCTDGGACDAGLECRSGICVEGGPLTTSTNPSSGPDSTSSSGPPGGSSEDDGPKLDVYAAGDLPVDLCEQDVDVVFTMDVSTSMTFFFDALLADMADVDAALMAVNANPRYGLIVFVDDYAVVNAGTPFDDIDALQAEFQTWKSFTTSFSEPQINGGMNTTFPENSLDALWRAAESFQWRPAASTLRLVIHATDDTFTEAPGVVDGITVEHTYDETITALQTNEVRVAAFAAMTGGSLFSPTDVSAGWFDDWTGGQPSIPESTGGIVFLIDGILQGSLSLGDAIVETVEEVECTPYPEG